MRMTRVNISVAVPSIIIEWGVNLVLLYRKRQYGYAFRRIKLTRGLFAIVDPEDYPRLARYKWYATSARNRGGKVYAERSVWYGKGNRKKRNVLMHRQILGEPKGMMVDHRNGNGCDNRKANLRIATAQQNVWNTRAHGKSRYKGVWQIKGTQKWCARIKVNGKVRNLGRFSDEAEAAKAYDRAAREVCGEFAVLNFPD